MCDYNINEQFNIAQDLFQHIQSCDVLEEKAVTSLQLEFEATQKYFKEETSSWGASESMETWMTCKTLCDKVASASTQQVTALQEAILQVALYSLLDTTVLDVQGFQVLKEPGVAIDERSGRDLNLNSWESITPKTTERNFGPDACQWKEECRSG